MRLLWIPAAVIATICALVIIRNVLWLWWGKHRTNYWRRW